MLLVLALRHLRVKKARSLVLLLGYGFGVGVMIVLLSVGTALLEQSRDVRLVGGGEVTVLPQGIDVEAMRTGGLSGMFFGIERARYLTRMLLGGPRHADLVRAVSPLIEHKLVYVGFRGQTVAARAGGEVPSRARATGAPLRLLAGRWEDVPADSAYVVPTAQQLYDELDRFHQPPRGDSSWAEWQYFNVVAGPAEWWYITYLVGGDVPGGRWGGQLLVTRRAPDGRHQRFRAVIPAAGVRFDTGSADLALGAHTVQQRGGLYRLRGSARGAAGRVELDLTVEPEPYRYFPPVALREGATPSGYAVPALSARARGRLCVNGTCRRLRDAPAYHDHNWGLWRGVTWEWGAARGRRLDLLYGVVRAPGDTGLGPGGRSLLVTLVDSLGVLQVLRASEIAYRGRGGGPLRPGERPAAFGFTATRDQDTLRVRVEVTDLAATRETAAGPGWVFLQMRGIASLEGRAAGVAVADRGWGFFETYVRAGPTGNGDR
ncbi:MAG TPA: hypothetical protein VNJ71_08445 [Gemmatimonadales bacterium]|nr:hypothetical protein [Gemmatimonadales bacterium]